ncbi:MAG: transcriptional regulator [Candidatus Heimdallarchaeota archaeon]|nr:transcriptional regulator [Candidatus Heimdallarchaeota archaeon]
MGFDLQNGFQLTVLILAVPPTVLLFKSYRKTKFLDYLLFGLVFVSIIIAQLADLIRLIFEDLTFLIKIVDSAHLTIYLLLAWHALRTKWISPPKFISGVVILGYLSIEIVILSYKPETLTNPSYVLFAWMNSDRTFSPETYAVVTSTGTVIMGQSFRFIFFIYRLFVQLLFVYSYLTTKIGWDSKVIVVTKRWWISAVIILSINTMRLIGYSLQFWETIFLISDISNVVALGIIGYVSIRYPKGILVSHAQISHAVATKPITQELSQFGLLLNPVRLAIMDLLYQHDHYQSAQIRKFLNISWGKFAPHLDKLEKEGFITIKDEFIDSKPRKIVYLEVKGRSHYLEFQQKMLEMFSKR